MTGFESLESRLLLATASVGALKDNTLYEQGQGDISNGRGNHIFAGKTNTDGLIRRAVLAFDIQSAGIPPGSSITDVTLNLAVSKSRATSPDPVIAVHRLTKDWGEGRSDAENEEGMGIAAERLDATWIHPFYDSTMWDTPGGDFAPAASATALVGGVGTTAIWSSAQLAADVQTWVENPTTNFGWILIGDESSNGTTRRFWSKDSLSGLNPRLDITFETNVAALSVDNATVSENGGVALLTATLFEVQTEDTTFDLAFTGTATDGDDYVVSDTQIIVPSGGTTGSVSVTAVQDAVLEPDETVTVSSGRLAAITITIVEDDLPSGFAVSSFTPTLSGFRAEFSAELDPSDLNLFDSRSAGLGPADLVLTGATTGPVTGSLLTGASDVTFVRTTEQLAPDRYFVALRSGPDAFKGISGQLLDGDGDGDGGDDYIASFVVDELPPDAIALRLPSFVRGPGQPVNLPAEVEDGIPLSLSQSEGVRSIELDIRYDPKLLQITAAAVSPEMPIGATVILNDLTPGVAALTFFSPVPLPAGSHEFVNLTASVPEEDRNEVYGRLGRLTLESVSIRDGDNNELPALTEDGFHLVTYFGDVSGNGRINAGDAAQLARIAALLDSGSAATPLIDPRLIGDVGGNGRLNAADASRIARFAALIDVPEIPPIPTGVFGRPLMAPKVSSVKRTARSIAPEDSKVPLVTYDTREHVPTVDRTLGFNSRVDEALAEEEFSLTLGLEIAIAEILSGPSVAAVSR